VDTLVSFIWLLGVWLREPLLLIGWAVMLGIVLGAGRSVGLPLLFWHERAASAFLAGLAATLFTAETFFVLFLIHSNAPGSARFGLGAHLTVGGAIWLAIVGARAVQLHRTALEPAGRAGAGGEAGDARGLAPRVHAVVPGEARLGALTATPVSPWPFARGAVLGAILIVIWVLVDRLLFGDEPRYRHLHVLAAIVTAAMVVTFLAIRRTATPAIGLSMLLALFAATYGFVTYQTGSRGLLLVVGVLLLWLAGRPRYRLRVPALAALYPARGTPAPYPPPVAAQAGPEGLRPLLLDRLASAAGDPGDWPDAPLPARRPLILICTSGGGIRAATWTAGVLGTLDALPGFRLAARMISGASGGMVGAAFWVAWQRARVERDPAAALAPAGPEDWRRLAACVATDSLTATSRRLFFRDLPMAFWPGPNRHDRGRALEDAWIEHVAQRLQARLDVPMARLRDGEERGFWPSLVFSPMLVEDGRRLLLTNLALARVIVNQARWLSAGAAANLDTSSVTAFTAAQLFPGEWPRFPLSTAARLSAAFPYVSAAVTLPTAPRRRVVDAGYYDNYGMDLACGWLREALACQRAWLAAHVSAVLVVQIRDNVSNLSVNPDSESERRSGDLRAGPSCEDSILARGFEGVSSPPEALLAARDSVALFRSDAQLEALTQLFHEVCGRPDFVTTTVFEFKGEASLSWYLTRDEIRGIDDQVTTPAIQGKVDTVGKWLYEHGGIPTPTS
jgi:Patatin-like phospholipase